MAKGQLFEYAVLYHPKQTKEQHDRGEEPRSTILVEPTTVIAGSKEEVAMMAARAIPVSHENKLEETEIKVRPF